ncbi:MAG: hypothetical protein IH987_09710 [Planctomycetes bacterium]|nr:hypothetical protein [Planctomycetota bacterium]
MNDDNAFQSQSDYLICEGRHRLFLTVILSGRLFLPPASKSTEDTRVSRLAKAITQRLNPGMALKSPEPIWPVSVVEKLVKDGLNYKWVEWGKDGDVEYLLLTPAGEDALRGAPREPTVEVGDDATKILLELLERAKRERNGVLRDDPRLLEYGIMAEHFRPWAIQRGLSEDSYKSAHMTILIEGWAVETHPKPVIAVVSITPRGENVTKNYGRMSATIDHLSDRDRNRLAHIPSLPPGETGWLTQAAAARKLIEATDDIAIDAAISKKKVVALRTARRRGAFDPDRTRGIDKDGNIWRQHPTEKNIVLYLESSLSNK